LVREITHANNNNRPYVIIIGAQVAEILRAPRPTEKPIRPPVGRTRLSRNLRFFFVSILSRTVGRRRMVTRVESLFVSPFIRPFHVIVFLFLVSATKRQNRLLNDTSDGPAGEGP